VGGARKGLSQPGRVTDRLVVLDALVECRDELCPPPAGDDVLPGVVAPIGLFVLGPGSKKLAPVVS